MMDKKDVGRLRELARQVREIAELPVQQQHKQLWTAVNDLKATRPVLHVRDLQLHLLHYGDELVTTIEEPFLRTLELDLLIKLYEWKHLRLNRVIEPVIRCNCVFTDSGFGLTAHTGIQADFIMGKEYDHAEHFEPQIFTIDDLEMIKTPQVSYDEAATMARFAMMKEIFDGILEVRLHGRNYFRHVPWDDLLSWMGISEGLYNFALDPDLMHAAIRRYTDATIAQVRQYEALGILSSNNNFDNVGNNDPGFTSELPPPTESGIGAKLADIWGSNADQVLTSVSPAMSEEFAFEYEREYADLFGLYGYGCCDRLDHKMPELRRSFKNLRKISVSPYADLENAFEQIGRDYVICFKPNSNYFVGENADMDYLRDELHRVCALTKKYNANVVINMKTIISLSGDPTRLWQWCDMASEILAQY